MAVVQLEQQKLDGMDFPANAKDVLHKKTPMRDFVLKLPKQD